MILQMLPVKEKTHENNERQSATGRQMNCSCLRKKGRKDTGGGWGTVKQKKERMHCLTLSVENINCCCFKMLQKTLTFPRNCSLLQPSFVKNREYSRELGEWATSFTAFRWESGRLLLPRFWVLLSADLRTCACFLALNVFHLSSRIEQLRSFKRRRC